jgi:hypothetical protein
MAEDYLSVYETLARSRRPRLRLVSG